MPTLYLRDVPAVLYTRLRGRARRNRRSMNAEAIEILRNTLDADEAGEDLVARLRSLQFTVPDGFPTPEELIRMDRDDPGRGRPRR